MRRRSCSPWQITPASSRHRPPPPQTPPPPTPPPPHPPPPRRRGRPPALRKRPARSFVNQRPHIIRAERPVHPAVPRPRHPRGFADRVECLRRQPRRLHQLALAEVTVG